MSRLHGLSSLKTGESPDRLWYFSPNNKERAIQQKEFSAYQAAFIRYAANALGIRGFTDIGRDNGSGDHYVPGGDFWIGDDSIWLGDTEVEEEVILALSDSDDSDEEDDSQEEDDSEEDDSEVEDDTESRELSNSDENMRNIGESSEALPESSDDVDSDASYTSGFSSDIENDGNDDANREESDGNSNSGNSDGGNVDAGGSDRDDDIGGNDADDEAE